MCEWNPSRSRSMPGGDRGTGHSLSSCQGHPGHDQPRPVGAQTPATPQEATDSVRIWKVRYGDDFFSRFISLSLEIYSESIPRRANKGKVSK